MEPITLIRSKTVVMPSTNIDTDQIIPARFLTITTKEGLGRELFADLRYDAQGTANPAFILNQPQSQGCTVLVAGKNFGCGSSREQATAAVKYAGVGAVIAPSFARIFYRNSINLGLPVVTSKEAPEVLEEGDEIEIDLTSGMVKRLSDSKEVPAAPLDARAVELLDAGGLIPYLRKKYA